MRVEPFTIGSYVHIVKRGARGLPITNDLNDKYRFLQLLYYMNDEYSDPQWVNKIKNKSIFYRPEEWPCRLPIPSRSRWRIREEGAGAGTFSLTVRFIGQSLSCCAGRPR